MDNVIRATGGSDIHVLIEFPTQREMALFYLGSAISLSYSVHRVKVPIFNCGNQFVSGFAIGNKYVAGSLIEVVLDDNKFANLTNEIYKKNMSVEAIYSIDKYKTHNIMKDDLAYCNIHVVFTSEYSGKQDSLIINGATFINNGQVMSIHDLITESTLQFVGKTVIDSWGQDDIKEGLFHDDYIRASDLL